MTYIRVIDLETDNDVVVEIGWCDLVAHGVDLSGAPCHWEVGDPRSMLVDPGRPISPETSAIHHIIDEDVAGALSWFGAAAAVLFPDDPPLAFAAHSAKEERRFLDDIMPGATWIDTYKVGLRLWPLAPSHSNQGLRYLLRPQGLQRAVAHPAHRGGPDAYVTAFTLREALGQQSIEQLREWSDQPALQTICRIGDWRGKRWSEVDDGFLHWILRKDFDEDVVFTVRTELERRQREQEDFYAQQRSSIYG